MSSRNGNPRRLAVSGAAAAAVALVWAAQALALDERYAPFSKKEMEVVKSTRLKPSSDSSLVVTVDCFQHIAIGGGIVYEQPVDYYLRMTKAIVGDLDGNGLDVAHVAK